MKAANGDVTIGLRPHHISVVEAGKGNISARVSLVEALGSETIVHTKLPGGQTMLAVLAGQRPIAAGDTMDLKFDTSQLHLFDKAGLRITAA